MPTVNEADIAKATEETQTVNLFTNDLSEADKETIRVYVKDSIEEILAQATFSTNDLCHLSQVSHGSIKSRGKNTSSGREIVLGVINGTRAERKAMSVDNAASFLLKAPEFAGLTDEEKLAKLMELLTKK